jgi:pimeloyl-ACP methyl ester carboxylesterase
LFFIYYSRFSNLDPLNRSSIVQLQRGIFPIEEEKVSIEEAVLEEHKLAAKPRSRLRVWTRRIVLGLLVGLVLLVVAGAIYQATGARADVRAFPPPGQLVDMGGYSLHIYCTGPQDSGNPTVILETLSGGVSPLWGWVQPEIAQVTRVCSYDRAGRGWSGARIQPITLQGTVNDLHALLQKAGVPAPYVLVGHSIGGIYTRKFIADHPDEVVGLVLVDAAHPEQLDRLPQIEAERASYLRMSALFPALARIGLFRLYFATGGEIDFADLPELQHDEVAAFWSSPEYFTSQRDETIVAPQIYADGQSLGDLGDLPLAVVTQSHGDQNWNTLQDELASLSTNSTHITLPGSTHSSLAMDPQHARETSAAILKIVEATGK